MQNYGINHAKYRQYLHWYRIECDSRHTILEPSTGFSCNLHKTAPKPITSTFVLLTEENKPGAGMIDGHHTLSTILCCSAAEEQFEAGGEELRRHFSMDGGMEPERLRAAPSAEAQRQAPDALFTGDAGFGDDVMSTGKYLQSCMKCCVTATCRSMPLLMLHNVTSEVATAAAFWQAFYTLRLTSSK